MFNSSDEIEFETSLWSRKLCQGSDRIDLLEVMIAHKLNFYPY